MIFATLSLILGSATARTAAPLRPEDLTDLTARIGRGDAQAESLLVERFSRGLRVYIRRLGCDDDLADDLHQETFRVVIERLRERDLDDPQALAGFLRGTARRLLFDLRRKAARRRTDVDDEAVAEVEDPAAGQLHRILDAEAAGLVRRLLADLEPPRDREILYRFYISEDHKEAICRDYELTALHFNRVLFRARQRFRRLLEGLDEGLGAGYV